MPYRGGRVSGGYGRNYSPVYLDDEGGDPLASAIHGALAGFETVQGWKQRKADRELELAEMARQQEQEDADRAFRREQWDYGVEQDALARQERTDDRRQAAIQRQGDMGVRFTGNMNFPLVKTGPSKMEREATLEAAIKDQLERPDLIATADQLGIPNASQLPNARLRAMVEAKQGEQKKADRFAEIEHSQKMQRDYAPPPDPSMAASRDALEEQRRSMVEQRRQGSKRSLADKYIEASGGDANRAWRMMSESDAQMMGEFQMRPPDLLAAAQRYKDRRNPPARPSSGGGVMDDLDAMLADESAGGRAGGPPAPGGRPASDADILAAIKAVGEDEQAVRAWLVARGINPDG